MTIPSFEITTPVGIVRMPADATALHQWGKQAQAAGDPWALLLLAFGQEMEGFSYAAADLFSRWMAEPGASGFDGVCDWDARVCRLRFLVADASPEKRFLDLFKFLIITQKKRMFAPNRYAGLSLLAGASLAVFRGSYARKQLDYAEALHSMLKLVARNTQVPEDLILYYMQQILYHWKRGDECPSALQDVLDPTRYPLHGKICQFPLVVLSFQHDGQVSLCCPPFLPLNAGPYDGTPGEVEGLGNGPNARKIRRSVLQGSYDFCRRTCTMLSDRQLIPLEECTDPVIRHFGETGETYLEKDFTVRVGYDQVCNLCCPSCRATRFHPTSEEIGRNKRITENTILPFLPRIRYLEMNGIGDALTNPSCRRILSYLEEHPELNVSLRFLTNGVVFSPEDWSRYPLMSQRIDQVRVSVDAVTEETYRVLRRGGDFAAMRRNVVWLAEQRKAGKINIVSVEFVYQAKNFREMLSLIRWAKDLELDGVWFERIANWNSYSKKEFEAQDVASPLHPEHQEFLSVLADPLFGDPILIGNPRNHIPFLPQ